MAIVKFSKYHKQHMTDAFIPTLHCCKRRIHLKTRIYEQTNDQIDQTQYSSAELGVIAIYGI